MLHKSIESSNQKFVDEMTKPTKEKGDTVYEENIWHHEKTQEIHEQFGDCILVALRSQHAKSRKEFLCH